MRVAFLCKRRYMGKDVIDDRYARLYEIPAQLAKLGHEVHGYCLGYQTQLEGDTTHAAEPGTLVWHARSLGNARLSRLLGYPRWLLKQLRALAPDLLIGASDIPHVALTAWMAKKLGVPYVVDLYDNFEAFGQARLPGFKGALRRATRRADLVTTTSDALRELVIDGYAATGRVISMPSTVDLSVFLDGDKSAARTLLGLPKDALLIGTAGGLHADKGVDVLYDAWAVLREKYPQAHLVLAGPADAALPPPQGQRVHYLGMLAHAQTATLFQALDIGVIYLRDTPFGRYCFPQKAYEMFACDLPVVSADVGVMSHLLSEWPASLYQPDNVADLLRALDSQIACRAQPSMSIEDWQTIITKLEPSLVALTRQRRHTA